MAEKIQIDIDTYDDYKSLFPTNYFDAMLNSDMTRDEVHQRVTEYEKVMSCGKNREVYYYYTRDDDTATRFEIRYDEANHFKELKGEDDDSATIQVDYVYCEEGLLIP